MSETGRSRFLKQREAKLWTFILRFNVRWVLGRLQALAIIKMNNKMVHMVAFILLVVGGLNWLLVGAFDMNIVEMIFGSMPTVVTVIYIFVGLSALYELVTHKGHCTACSSS